MGLLGNNPVNINTKIPVATPEAKEKGNDSADCKEDDLWKIFPRRINRSPEPCSLRVIHCRPTRQPV